MFTLGVTVGAYWEIFEWFFVGKYTMADTISDVLVDSGGVLAAVPITPSLVGRKKFAKSPPRHVMMAV